MARFSREKKMFIPRSHVCLHMSSPIYYFLERQRVKKFIVLLGKNVLLILSKEPFSCIPSLLHLSAKRRLNTRPRFHSHGGFPCSSLPSFTDVYGFEVACYPPEKNGLVWRPPVSLASFLYTTLSFLLTSFSPAQGHLEVFEAPFLFSLDYLEMVLFFFRGEIEAPARRFHLFTRAFIWPSFPKKYWDAIYSSLGKREKHLTCLWAEHDLTFKNPGLSLETCLLPDLLASRKKRF